MTSLAPISPISSVADVCTGDYNLFFTEFITQYPEYALFWRKKSGIKIMDCLIHERQPLPTPATVYSAAKQALPTYVSIPDKVYDGAGTLHLFIKYYELLKLPDSQPLGVAQGKDLAETVQCALDLYKFTSVIGLHQGIKRVFNQDRGSLADQLHDRMPQAKFHLLGIPPSGIDFEPRDYILGTDSAKPVYQGLYGLDQSHRPQEFLNLQRKEVIPKLQNIRTTIAWWTKLVEGIAV